MYKQKTHENKIKPRLSLGRLKKDIKAEQIQGMEVDSIQSNVATNEKVEK